MRAMQNENVKISAVVSMTGSHQKEMSFPVRQVSHYAIRTKGILISGSNMRTGHCTGLREKRKAAVVCGRNKLCRENGDTGRFWKKRPARCLNRQSALAVNY